MIINYQTTVECEVVIPEEAQSWISIAPATRALVSELATLTVAENTTYSKRSAIVKVVAVDNNSLVAKYTITQDGNPFYIEYTSTDGKVVTPNNADVFGAHIIHNEYIDGKGVITFDGDVTEIGDEAFGDCSSLESITIPNSVTSIGKWAFCVCSSLTSITIPDGVTSIGGYAFGGCTSLEEFSGNFASEDGRCLIVDGVLKSFAPAGLTEYTIPNNVTSIGEGAFSGCSNLTSITIPDSVTSIGEEAFCWCSSLVSVTIPDSVTSIGELAFYDCSNLVSITIPDSVTSIGEEAFCWCSSLAEVYCKPTIPPTGSRSMFGLNASGRKIYVPTESVEAYKSAEYWSNYANNIVGYDFE